MEMSAIVQIQFASNNHVISYIYIYIYIISYNIIDTYYVVSGVECTASQQESALSRGCPKNAFTGEIIRAGTPRAIVLTIPLDPYMYYHIM
jgi:hypothetical protein